MVDLHSHILPGLDDGSKNIEEALALARQSVNEGVHSMVCTPHINYGIFDNDDIKIRSAFTMFVESCQEENIALSLAYAAEVRLCPEITYLVKNNKLPFIGRYNGRDALLLELPHSHIPTGSDILIRWLLSNGVQPVIPHPERNREIQADYTKLHWLNNIGGIFQVTAGSLLGTFKTDARNLSLYMLDNNMAAYVASDLHNLKRRPNEMNSAKNFVKGIWGDKYANELFSETPSSISRSLKWLNT